MIKLYNLLLHIFIKLCRSLTSDFIKVLLFLNSLLVYCLAARNVIDIFVRERDWLGGQELLHSRGVCNLRVMEKRSDESSQRNALLFPSQDNRLLYTLASQLQTGKPQNIHRNCPCLLHPSPEPCVNL